MKRGLAVGTGGEAWDRNLTIVHSDSAVTEAGPQREDDIVIPEPLLGLQTPLCLSLPFFFFNLLFASLCVQSVSLEGRGSLLAGKEGSAAFLSLGGRWARESGSKNRNKRMLG